MKKLIFTLLFIGSFSLAAQESQRDLSTEGTYALPKFAIEEVEEDMALGLNTGLAIVIPDAELKNIEKNWKKELKEYKAKVKGKDGESIATEANIPNLSRIPITVYTQMAIEGENTRMVVFFDLGTDFINSMEYVEKYGLASQMLETFGLSHFKWMIENELKAEEKNLSKLESALKKLEKKNKGLHSDIKKYNKSIKEAEGDIKNNERAIETQEEMIETQQEIVNGASGEALEDANKDLSDLIKDKKKMGKEIDKANKSIKKNENNIEDAEKDIEQNLVDQDNTRKAIAEQKEVVAYVSWKLKSF